MPLTIYKSSAGSGKTYTLVREYIRLLINAPFEYKNILAITFTNKATSEMKTRIVKSLARIADEDVSPEEESLKKELVEHFDSRLKVEKNAALALSLILHNYTEFSVSTIDSFFQKILRSFSRELRVPIRYELEMNSDLVLDQIIAQLMMEIGKVDGLTKWLVDLAFTQMEDDRGWKISAPIKDLGKQIFREYVWEQLKTSEHEELEKIKTAHEEKASAEVEEKEKEKDEGAEEKRLTQKEKEAQQAAARKAILDAIREERYKKLQDVILQMRKMKRAFEADLKQASADAYGLIEHHGLKASDFQSGTFNFFDNIVKQELDWSKKKRVLSLIDGNMDVWATKSSRKREFILEVARNGLHDHFMKTVNYIKENLKDYQSAKAVLRNIHLYGLLNDLKDKLRDHRTEQRLLLISDTNNLLRSVIADGDAPFVYEKVGLLYKHILLDEFQDTSVYQWQNLLPLVEDTLGNGDHTLVVGDAKQSIYRFRGGDMELLLSGVQNDLALFKEQSEVLDLDSNYRSREHIVRFNNAFFASAVALLGEKLSPSGEDRMKQAYAGMAQKVVKKGGGFVSVNCFEKDKENDLDWKEQAEIQSIKEIHRLVAKGYALKDMAFLVNTNKEATAIAEKLTEEGIAIISSESLRLCRSSKVQLLISCIRYLNDPKDAIAQTQLLYHYLLLKHPQHPLLEQEELHELFVDHKSSHDTSLSGNVDEGNEEKEKTILSGGELFEKYLPKTFIAGIDTLSKQPLYELVELLCIHFELTDPVDSYVQYFMDYCLNYNTRKSTQIAHFLEWWDDYGKLKDKSAAVIVPQGQDAVTVLTVHKSKGLEYPVVFMPYCNWALHPKSDGYIWASSDRPPFKALGAIPVKLDKKLLDTHFEDSYREEWFKSYVDRLNTLYVAFTRAADRLYIYSSYFKSSSSDGTTVSQLIFQVMESEDFELTLDDEFDGLFTYGDRASFFPHKSDMERESVSINRYVSNDYREKIQIKSEADKDICLFEQHSPDTLEQLEEDKRQKIEQGIAKRRGRSIHLVLEKLAHEKDFEKVIRQLKIKGLLTFEDEEVIRERISHLFEREDILAWFDKSQWDEIFIERPMFNNNRTYIADRVLVKDGKAIIIDYKTSEKSKTAAEIRSAYKKQINNYGDIIQSMGYEVVGKYLLHISDIIEVVEVV